MKVTLTPMKCDDTGILEPDGEPRDVQFEKWKLALQSCVCQRTENGLAATQENILGLMSRTEYVEARWNNRTEYIIISKCEVIGDASTVEFVVVPR